ncbi:MAG: 5'-nucleotidase C-terminal domain-containing protein [Betaproteobacteria bacterium]
MRPPNAVIVEPGALQMVALRPNPAGSLDALFALHGDATGGPVEVAAHESPWAPAARSGSRRLRIFHFNDLHNYLQAPDAAPGENYLFSRIVARFRAACERAASDEIVLLLSGGDDHTGTPFDELLGWHPDEMIIDPAYAAYSAAGVDAASLGNHDLDRGGALLAAGIRRNAAFPVLSANVHGCATLQRDRDYFSGAIAVAKGLRIGLIGLTTPIDTRTATAADPGLTVASPLITLRNMLPGVAALSDIVIIMSHCGYGTDQPGTGSPFGAGYLAEGDIAIARLAATLTERPVLVLGGHTHTVLNAGGFGPDTLIDGIPVVQAGGQGSHLGEFQATLALAATRRQWSIDARLHALTGSARGPPAPSAAKSGIADVDIAFEAEVIAPMLALVRQRIDEILATVDDDCDLSRETTLRRRYMGECALINFICDALVQRSAEMPHGPVDLAMINSTAIGDGIAPGIAAFRDWYRVQPFADVLQIGEITGAGLASILRSNARRIVREEELTGRTPVDPRGYVPRGFLHFSGALRYTIIRGASAREATVTGATIAGVPLETMRATLFRVMFTNYLGAGGYAESWNGSPIGAGVPGTLAGFDLRGIPKHDTGLVFRNEVIAHVRTVGRVGASTGAILDGRMTLR